MAAPERLLAEKYMEKGGTVPDGQHAWLRIDPIKIVSWGLPQNSGGIEGEARYQDIVTDQPPSGSG